MDTVSSGHRVDRLVQQRRQAVGYQRLGLAVSVAALLVMAFVG